MLKQLVDYARTHLDSEPGFKTRSVHWIVDISMDGQLINVLPLGDKKGEVTLKCPDMHNMNARGRAHFLVETVQTISMLCKKDETSQDVAKARRKRMFFRKLVFTAANGAAHDLQPLAKFMTNRKQLRLLRDRFGKEKAKPTHWMRWRIAGKDPLMQSEILDWWRTWRDADQIKAKTKVPSKRIKKSSVAHDEAMTGSMVCFLSGETLKPLATHRPINGLVGGHPTGDVMVGFDKAAFRSFGLRQSRNAAMGENVAQEYVDALNHLVRSKNNSHKLPNALVIHWFENAVSPENDPLSIFSEPPELTEGAAQQSARQILDSLRRGLRPIPANNKYFAMTISGASKRVMVRDWMEGSFEELIDRVEKWFVDLEITGQNNGELARDPRFNDVCLSMVRYDPKKTYFDNLKQLPAPTASTLWRVALLGLPIPQPFVAQALHRFRVDLIEDKPFNHTRMGLIKTYFIRKGGDHHMSAYLNKEHPEPAYQCGRLLATLAGLQYSALGDVGAGVVQRYYMAASQMPGLIVGRLVGNAKNHLGKLDGGLAHWYENQIAEIMSHIQDRIPATLNLDQQGLFALGYYQQIAANRAGSKSTNSTDTEKEATK